MKRCASMPVLVLVVLVAVSLALAQSGYELTWWTLDGGGGISRGGSYTLSGTAGQTDAGRLEGGAYTLEGGFWAPASAGNQQSPPSLYLPLI